MISLFDDQTEFIGNIRAALKSYRRVLAYAPTAFGKTTCFSYMAGRAASRDVRVGIGVHRDELVSQVSQTLARFNIPHGIIASDASFVPNQRVYVVSVPTYVRRLGKVPKFGLILQDEAHHAINGNQWGEFLAHSDDPITVGFSASPIRLDGRGMRESFDTIVLGPSVRSLMNAGRLSKYRAFLPPPVIDTSQLHVRAGEYKTGEVEGVIDKPAVYGNAIEHYRRICDWKRAVIFTVSVAAAHHAAEEFNAAGYRAVAIDGTVDKHTRRNMIRDYNDGKLSHLASCSIVDEGFDCPGIEVAIDLCPTMSLQRAIQRWGRTLRVAPGKEFAYLLDHVGNIGKLGADGLLAPKHGFPDDDREWSLDGVSTKPKSDVVHHLMCKRCFATAVVGRLCMNCGERVEATAMIGGRTLAQIEAELQEVAAETARQAAEEREAEERRRAISRAKTPEEMAAIGVGERQANHILAARQEKDAMRETLFQTARELAYRTGWHELYRAFSKPKIRELKPAALRLMIDDMREVLREHA